MLELGTFGSVRGVPGNGYPTVILGQNLADDPLSIPPFRKFDRATVCEPNDHLTSRSELSAIERKAVDSLSETSDGAETVVTMSERIQGIDVEARRGFGSADLSKYGYGIGIHIAHEKNGRYASWRENDWRRQRFRRDEIRRAKIESVGRERVVPWWLSLEGKGARIWDHIIGEEVDRGQFIRQITKPVMKETPGGG